jgi:putative DNA-invertase from lambdoid prophage Rac
MFNVTDSRLGLPTIVADEGVSDVAVPLAERPQGRRLFDMLRRDDAGVVRRVDRLGRNYSDVCDNIREFMRRGILVKTVINGLTFDGATKDPMQKAVRDALIAFMAATAEAQAEAQRAGIAHARATEPQSYRGRKPTFDREALALVRDMLAQSVGPSVIAKAAGVARQTVYRIKDDPAKAEALLMEWAA